MTSEPSCCELKQGGAGLETVGEAFLVSIDSENVRVVLGLGIWYKEVQIFGYSDDL